MPPKKDQSALAPTAVESRIRVVCDVRVLLDSDLAELYGTTTAAINQAVDRNPERFPDDFAFRLTQQEVAALISQSVISKAGRGGRTKQPRVFTEHGVAMLSSVLRSPTAIQVNVEIIRAFVRLRRLLATPGDLAAQLTRLAETVQLHDDQIKVITEVLKKMMEPPPPGPKRRIGFQPPGSADGAVGFDERTSPESTP